VSPAHCGAQNAGRTYRIGFLLPSTRESLAVVALFDELRLNGFVEGQNLIVIPGAFGIPNDQIANVVASLVAASPDVIVSGPELPLRALQQATRTIPLIGMTEDMVADGLVASFARPGGNITGISLLSPELDGKRQEILIEAIPGERKIAVLADSNVAKAVHLQQLQQAAQNQGVEALVRGVAKRDDVISAMNDVKASGAQAINFLATPMFSVNAADFIRQVTILRLPSIYQWRKTRRTEPSLLTVPASRKCIVSARGKSSKCCVVQSRPTSRSNSRPSSNSSSTCRPPRQSVMKYQPASSRAPPR
jgi:putative ABC transport system substrate-binding protein